MKSTKSSGQTPRSTGGMEGTTEGAGRSFLSEVESLLEPALAVARQAADRILEIYETDFKVVAKPDDTPLTRADMAAHNTIEAGLRRLTPDLPILSEESDPVAWAQRRRWQRYWLVDPLDGTREFVRRSGHFCVNVALIDGFEAVLGVIYAPVTGEAWLAARGAGAYKREAAETTSRRLSCRLPRDEPVVAGSNSRHRGPRTRAFLEALGEHEQIRQGSAIKFGLIAEGVADLYLRIGPTSEWDTAAGQCLLEEAGGRVVDLQGRRLVYNATDSLLNTDFLASGAGDRDWIAVLKAAQSED